MSGRVKIPGKRAALQRVAGHVASNQQSSGTDEILGDPGAEELLTPAEAARLDWAVDQVVRRLYRMGGQS